MSFAAFLRQNLPFLTVGFLLTFTSSYGQTFFISIFAGEIRTAFDLSHGEWGLIYTIATTASAAGMVFAGALVDRFRVRGLAVFILFGLAAACLGMAGAQSWGVLVLAIFALRFFGQGMSSHMAIAAMARWFVARRGKALSIATLGVTIGQALLPLVFVALLARFDWRALWVIAAALVLLMLPLLLRLLREERTPQSVADEVQSFGMNGRHWTRRDVLAHWLFWMMVPALLGPAAFSTAFFFQQVHIAEVKDWAHVELVALFPVYTVGSVAAMLVSGWAVDKFGTALLVPFVQIPIALGFFMFAPTESFLVATVAMVLMAMTIGAGQTVVAAFWAEFYGTRFIGGIKALAAAVMVFGTAIGPGVSGWLIDLGIDFPDQMIWIGFYFLGASALLAIGVLRARRTLPAPEVDVVRS